MRALNEMVLADLIAARAETAARSRCASPSRAAIPGREEIRTYAQLWANANRLAAGLARARHELRRPVRDSDAQPSRVHRTDDCGLVDRPACSCRSIRAPAGSKLAYTLNNSGCRGIICADYSLAQVGEMRGQVPTLEWIWVLESGEETNAPLASDVEGCIQPLCRA